MPFIIEEANFSRKLELTSENYIYTKNLLEKGVVDYPLPGLLITTMYRFVKSIHSDQYSLLFITSKGWLTVYSVKLAYQKEITYPQLAATQIMVWRSPSILHKPVLNGFPQLFFTHLLSTANIVISDKEQTVHGQRFWKGMLEWGFYNHYNIYVTDGTKGENCPKQQIENINTISELWEQYVWGNDKEVHLHRLFIISKYELETTSDFDKEK